MSLFIDRLKTRMARAMAAQLPIVTAPKPERERRTYHHITPELIMRVKTLHNNKHMQTQIAEALDLSPTTVNRICRGKYDDRLPDPPWLVDKVLGNRKC